jgi:vancomycin resistance protein YoaR
MRMVPIEILAAAAVVVAGAALVIGFKPQPVNDMLASYTTDLADRTPHQRFNAQRAASRIDGVVVKPGMIFSFDDAVGGWSADQGYLKAPVSYNGVLIDDYGGGVCETSTTVYNAALLAGLPILERHAHTFSPSYAPPGRDAAVAYPSADLKFRNDTGAPLTIRVAVDRDRLVCRLLSLNAHPQRVTIVSRILDRKPPSTVSPDALADTSRPRSRWRVRGRDGLRVAVYRSRYENGQPTRRELVSDDTYLPISRFAW